MVRDVAYVEIPGSRDEVLKVLQKRHVSGVPVVKKGEVVGMITRNDLLRSREEDQTALLMSRDPVTVGPKSTIVEAARLLLKHGIRRLPVVEDSTLVGIITIADIVRFAADMNIPSKIEPYFERKILVLWSEMPLPVAGAIMEYAKVEACPVIDSGLKLVGIISDRDLIGASVIEESVEKMDITVDAGEDAWMWDRYMQGMDRYYAISRIELRNVKVGEAMVPAMTAIKSTNVSESAGIMSKNRIDQIPVVTSSQKLMGLLRDKDIAVALIDYFEQSAA
jgi:CBS domain-containing protein